MTTCVLPPWAYAEWGMSPWGGSGPAPMGGPLPVADPFNIYCVGPCAQMSVFLTFDGVSISGLPSQFPLDVSLDQILASGGGTYVTDEAQILVSESVPDNWTLEFTVKFSSLPNDFSSLVPAHAFVGASDASGVCAGLFFSRVGLAYTGCVHLEDFGSGNELVQDTLVQPLPNSQLLVSENEYWTVRIAASGSTSTVFIYVTKTDELLSLGHQLRYVLPSIYSATASTLPADQTQLLCRGTVSAPTIFQVDSICLGAGVIAPNLPPVADAGFDQALRTCSILQLDGSASFDPENAALSYFWRLLDAPLTSQSLFEGSDGGTTPLPVPTGFTDRFYSSALGVEHGFDPFLAGDVLVVGAAFYSIVATGSVGGFFVRVDGYSIPDNFSGLTPFRVLRQRGISGALTDKPTFYPDVPGLYKFDLRVFDGQLFSLPSIVVTNVVESLIARNCSIDTKFLWSTLSDFWKLVEDKERLDVYFEGLAQVAASELLTLWQVEYSKSLRDIQRTFQRRWLHYDTTITETPAQVVNTTVTAVYGGLYSNDIAVAGAALGGTHVDFLLATQSAPVVITLPGAALYTPAQVQAQMQSQFYAIDSRITVTTVLSRDGLQGKVRIDAPFAISLLAATTCPAFSAPAANTLPSGTGNSVGVRTYRVDRTLGPKIGQGDFLVLGDVGYRIARVVDDASDALFNQRVALLDDLPIPAPTTWKIAGRVTSPDVDFYAGLVTEGDIATLDVINFETAELVQVSVRVLGVTIEQPSTLLLDGTILGSFIDSSTYGVFFQTVTRRKYISIDPLISDIPHLQENIRSVDDTQVLRRNVDFFIESYRDVPCIRFVVGTSPAPDVWEYSTPPAMLWAETTYIDNRPTIEENFGIQAAFTLDDLAKLPNNVDYLSAVRGLWYTHLRGPTLFNIRAGTQILLGLPFAEEAGTIVEIRDDFSSTTARLLVRDTVTSDIVRSYTYPAILSLEKNPRTGVAYVVGDTVDQFAPLVTGVEVTDYVKDPKWFSGYLGQGSFFEVEKFFKFLVRVDSNAFNLDALLFVQSFVRRIKPTYTLPIFVVKEALGEDGSTQVDVTDRIAGHVGLRIDDSMQNTSIAYDAPRAAGGGYQNRFDRTTKTSSSPTFPTAQAPINWGFDRGYNNPDDVITLKPCLVTPGGVGVFDGVLTFDPIIYSGEVARFVAGMLSILPAAGVEIPVSYTMLGALTFDTLVVNSLFNGALGVQGTPNFYLDIKKNASLVTTITLSSWTYSGAVSISVTGGDVIQAFLRPVSGLDHAVNWKRFSVTLGVNTPWQWDTVIAAGTYCQYKDI